MLCKAGLGMRQGQAMVGTEPRRGPVGAEQSRLATTGGVSVGWHGLLLVAPLLQLEGEATPGTGWDGARGSLPEQMTGSQDLVLAAR